MIAEFGVGPEGGYGDNEDHNEGTKVTKTYEGKVVSGRAVALATLLDAAESVGRNFFFVRLR